MPRLHPRTVRSLLAAATLTLVLTPTHALAQDAESTQVAATPPPPLDPSRMVVIGGSLWDVPESRMIYESWLPSAVGGYTPHPVVGRPDLAMFFHDHQSRDRRFPTFGAARGHWVLATPGNEEVIDIARTEFGQFHHEAVLTRDLRRVIYIEDGDVGLANINWTDGSLQDARKVTSIGVLRMQPPNVLTPTHAYYWAGFSEQNPVVRVDLETGQPDEIPDSPLYGNASNSWSIANPSGTYVVTADFTSTDATIHDITAGQAKTVHFGYQPPSSGNREYGPQSLMVDPQSQRGLHHWLDDHTLITIPVSRAGPVVAKLNVLTGETGIVFDAANEPQQPYGNSGVRIASLSPGGLAMAMSPKPGGNMREMDGMAAWLLDPRDGKRTPLEIPADEAANGFWANDHMLVFAKTDAGLSANGTWLFNLKTGQSVRLCPHPFHEDRSAAYLADIDTVVVAVSAPRGPQVYACRADGSEGRMLGGSTASFYNGVTITPISSDPIDLGLAP